MLALDEELLIIYFDFQRGKIDKVVIPKLFKYLQFPFQISQSQKNAIGLSDELAKALGSNGLIKIRNRQDEEDLVQKTQLKIMLTKDTIDGTFPYPYINILDDEVDVSFTATYKSGESRDKAKEHIKALLQDANEIKIFDRYLSKVNHNDDSWNINKQILLDILPIKIITIEIYCQDNWNVQRESDLRGVCTSWTINKQNWNSTIHDRYIETDKVIILLTSGLINLDNGSLKDFTYIVKVK